MLSPVNPGVTKNTKEIQTLFGGKIESQSQQVKVGLDNSLGYYSADKIERIDDKDQDHTNEVAELRGNLTDSEYDKTS